MDAHDVEHMRAVLALFVADVFASVPRKDQRAKSDCYLRGLMMDGRRKSVQAMAARLPDGNEPNLQQFVNQSTWDPVPVRRRIAERLIPRIGPDAWAIDDVSFPKDGKMSVGVAPQYCGALGKQANCQVAVSVQHVVCDRASCPLTWRLFIPEEWALDGDRRRRTGVPEEVTHREKWRLALDALDELAACQLSPPLVVADAGYGQNADLRAALTERGHHFVVGIRGDLTVQPDAAVPEVPAWSGTGRRPVSRYPRPPVSVAELTASASREAFEEVTWREGTRHSMASRFLALSVLPAGVRPRRMAKAAAMAKHGRWDGVLPQLQMLAGWPDGKDAPTRFWLSDLPADTPIATLLRLAKIRWRIEHDYRELKHGLGLDHSEGRSWAGWHHHVTLVTAAHAFLTEQRLAPKALSPA
ncbi:IS701 family transposase [Streptomyces sp. NPDC000349]|uniref:IS701 family transposase n=1 Tax=Streptomyces sp. NPDC000349 TaxID=3154249 RepID=UPI00336A5EAC